MKAKYYLMQVTKLDKLIENKLAEVEHWKQIAEGITASNDSERVQSSGSKQRMADAVCNYMQLESELNADIDRFVDMKKEIIKTIEQLDMDEYNVLHKRYVQGLELPEISDIIGKSYSWLTSKHGKALRDVQDILDEREVNND